MTPGGTADLERRIRELYDVDVRADAGVLHVTSTTRTTDGGLATIRIGEDAPPSSTDRFALDLARARSDAIITTGKVLRDEPDLSHALPEELRRWRRGELGKPEPAWSVVLSRCREIDLGHPLFATGRALVITTDRAAIELDERARAAGVRVLGRPLPSLRDVIAYLQGDLACRTISVEAGPSTSQTLYEDPFGIDELLLSIHEEGLDPALHVGRFLDEARLEALFGPPRSVHSREEQSGRWSFRRYRRRSRLEPRRSER